MNNTNNETAKTSSAVIPSQLYIGQTLFIVSDENIKVIPAIVSEKNVTETLKGDTVTWKVIVGPEHKRKTLALDKITGDKFATLEEARQELLSRFDSVLDEALEESANNAAVWYSLDINEVKGITAPVKSRTKKTLEPEEETMDASSLVDGIENAPRKAPVGRPKKSAVKPATNVAAKRAQESIELHPGDSPEVRKEKLRALMTVSDEELLQQGGAPPAMAGTQKIIMPDGEEVYITQ